MDKFRKFFVAIFLFCLVLGLSGCATNAEHCSNDWRITGYYTPVEKDFPEEKERIYIEKAGHHRISKAFLSVVKLEGWGKTRYGWYLGFYGQKWHRSDFPKNAVGKPLSIGQVATDHQEIPINAKVNIEGLAQSKLDHKSAQSHFVSTDSGSLIRGKKIDIYTGEGKSAQSLTYQITGNYRVCYASSIQQPPVISI